MATLKLNQAELLRRRQALIRQGQKVAFTSQVKCPTKPDDVPVKQSNTPHGVSRTPAKYLKHYDLKQKLLDNKGPSIKTNLAEIIPPEILLGHAVNITRRHMALRPDHLVRNIPTLDHPTAKTRAPARLPKDSGLTEGEKKAFRKMKWYVPLSLKDLKK